MASTILPRRRTRARSPRAGRTCPAHRAWVRRHHCCVAGCLQHPIECAHVRRGTDGGQALKPSDRWTISLCHFHHAEQHRIGEPAFEQRYALDLYALAEAFARRSPHWPMLGEGAKEGEDGNDSDEGEDGPGGEGGADDGEGSAKGADGADTVALLVRGQSVISEEPAVGAEKDAVTCAGKAGS